MHIPFKFLIAAGLSLGLAVPLWAQDSLTWAADENWDGEGILFSVNNREQLELSGDHYSLDLHGARNQLLRCYDTSGEEIFVLNAEDIWIEWEGTVYRADIEAFPSEMHLLNAGRHFVEAHVENIVLTAPSGNWPGLAELSIYAHQDALYLTVDLIANDRDWIRKRDELHGQVVYVYESREGFRNWPGGAPSLMGFDLTFSNSLQVAGNGIRLQGAPLMTLPTVPVDSAELTLVSNAMCRISVAPFESDWAPDSIHSSGAVVLFANTEEQLNQRVFQELNPLSVNHFDMSMGQFAGFDYRTGVYAINGSRPGTPSPPPGFMRGSAFTLSNDEAPRTLLFAQMAHWGGISGGIVRNDDLAPLPIDVQFGLSYPGLSQYGESGWARMFFPIRMEAGEQVGLRPAALYSSRTDRGISFLNMLEPGMVSSPGIIHVALDRRETHTTRLGREFIVTDFRAHVNDRLGASANASTIRFLNVNGVVGVEQLRNGAVRMTETGPDLYEYEVQVFSDDGSISGTVRVWGGATSDMNRFFSEVDLEFHAPVTLSETDEVPLRFLSYEVGNPMMFRKYAYSGENGNTVIGELTDTGSRTVHVSGAPMSTPFFAMMYEANNSGGDGITISDRSGNPVMMVSDWDVRFGNQQIQPGIRAFGSDDRRGIAIVPSVNSDFSGTIPAGSRIYYKTLHLTGGKAEGDHTLGESEFAAWSDRGGVTAQEGTLVSDYPINVRANAGKATFTLENGNNWIPVRVSGVDSTHGIDVTITDSEGERSPVTVVAAEPWYTVSLRPDGFYRYTFLVERRVDGPITVDVNEREAPLPYFDKAWEGGDGGWGTGANWEPQGIPAPEHRIEFVGEDSAVVTLGVDRTIRGMTFSKTATTTIASGHATASRFITLGSGGLSVSAGAGTVTFTRVPFNVNVDQEWENQSTNLVTAGSLINVASDSRPTLTVRGPGDILISGRIAHPDPDLWMKSLIKSGAGTLTLGDLYAETTMVENGTLLVNGRQDNRLNTAQVTVTSGGTLGGTGILQGPTSVSGNLRPGSNGIGLLTFENILNLLGGALTTLEIDSVGARGTSYDAINVTLPNGLTFGGELQLAFTGAAEVGSYNLFDFAGNSSGGLGSVTLAGSHAGSLSQAGAGVWSGHAGGLSFTFSELSGDLIVEVAVEPPPPSPPTISAIGDQTISVNTSTGALSFTVGSDGVDAGMLTLSGSSSNTTLAPDGNIVFGGNGADRSVMVTPAADQTGSARITVTVDDGSLSSSVTFELLVLSGEEPVVDVVVNPSEDPPVNFFLARSWHWDIDGDTEGWIAGGNGHLSLVPGTPVGGLISGTSTDVDPQWLSPASLGIMATEEMIIEFRIRKESADGTRLDLLWADSTGGFGGARMQTIPADTLPRDGEFHVVRMNFSHAIQGILSRLRFDPISGTSGIGMSFDLDYFRIYTKALPDSSTPPRLVIERWEENQVRLSWPLAAEGWTLESSTDLDGAYSDAGLTVSVEDDENAAYDQILSAKQFYRLAQ
jgi:hypothetical protein